MASLNFFFIQCYSLCIILNIGFRPYIPEYIYKSYHNRKGSHEYSFSWPFALLVFCQMTSVGVVGIESCIDVATLSYTLNFLRNASNIWNTKYELSKEKSQNQSFQNYDCFIYIQTEPEGLQISHTRKLNWAILDSKLTWNQQIDKITKHSETLFLTPKWMHGKSWSLIPTMVQ